jgi:Cft2 family RNA processing exonuclease
MNSQLNAAFKELKWIPDKMALTVMIRTVVKIIKNILGSNDEKYRTIRGGNPRIAPLLEHETFREFLVQLGFRKQVVDFKEYWILAHLSTICRAEFQDTVSELEEYLTRLPVLDESAGRGMMDAKERKKKHRSYVEKMLSQAEEDRLDKLERERRVVQKIKMNQDEEKRHLRENMEDQRRRLEKVRLSRT